jgi:hypothetical protein
MTLETRAKLTDKRLRLEHRCNEIARGRRERAHHADQWEGAAGRLWGNLAAYLPSSDHCRMGGSFASPSALCF